MAVLCCRTLGPRSGLIPWYPSRFRGVGPSLGLSEALGNLWGFSGALWSSPGRAPQDPPESSPKLSGAFWS
eukprot:11389910-Alexandrium_andersonii.AAC.1